MFDAPDRPVWALSITTLEYDKSAAKLIEKFGRKGQLDKMERAAQRRLSEARTLGVFLWELS
jgi:hypothetical protein